MRKGLSFLTLFFLIFFVNIGGSLLAYTYKLSICAIFQDEAPYMKEWIDYHRYMGVEHFWLYNNNSKDNYKEVLQPYIDQNIVELIDWPSKDPNEDFDHYCLVTQSSAYTHAIKKARYKSKWLAIIDLDEFIFPIADLSIIDCLEKRFYHSAGVCVNWQCYGTSNVEKIPDHVYIWDALVYKLKWNGARNNYFKSIVQPRYVTHCKNPHFCNYIHGAYHVNTKGEKAKINNKKVYTDIMVINHYWTRDEWYLNNIKIPRIVRLQGEKSKQLTLKEARKMNRHFDDTLSQRMKSSPLRVKP